MFSLVPLSARGTTEKGKMSTEQVAVRSTLEKVDNVKRQRVLFFEVEGGREESKRKKSLRACSVL